ncbi:MAG: M1 family metallopeptidase [Bacteroidetes bacterium]|nr:M1 family metallopeptidase [Bacteroidota bacterium]
MKRYILTFLFLHLACIVLAQALNDNTYRTSKNPLYWQNRKPDNAYWQQDVAYTIRAKMDEDKNMIDGSELLYYWNNSPDTLTVLYFHLFQNAFIKGSRLYNLYLANKQKPHLGKYESQGLGIVVTSMSVDYNPVDVELDNTVMKVQLRQPLFPGSRAAIKIDFQTYYDNGSIRRRMKMYDAWGFKHYNGTQWFPKICVYDRKFGWDTYQHLNREFYGDFGSYDVTLDFPSNYILEATGVLQDRKKTLPDTLREKLDVKNFANKKWDEAPSVVIPYKKGERREWHFKADNVHDFAFTADPTYRIGTAYWKDIECVAIVQEPHASGWQHAAEYVAKIIQTFSEDIGMYQYPKMVAADAADGMEYPMLRLDGGREPGFHGLLVHEIGHNWFYGMVGNNETYRASLDEGFTQFLTSWGLRRIDGDTEIRDRQKSWYRRLFAEPVNTMDRNTLYGYTVTALNQNELPLNTHSDDFHSALDHGGGYGMVYYKTASMLYNLQYVLGDSLFHSALKHYFAQWRFAHPYFEDFRASIINYTHVDLNWFFDEWLETTKQIDYGISAIKRISGSDSFAIKFKRKGDMQMPVDFTVTAKDGSKQTYTIPNTWFAKQEGMQVLSKWYGWGKMYPTYTAHVPAPAGIRSVQIDTSYRLADRDWEDNYKTRGLPFRPQALKLKFDGGLGGPADRRHYRMYWRPDLWWNPVDGIKAGLHIEGDYMHTLHNLDASIWWNTHVLQDSRYGVYVNEGWYDRYAPVNYSFNYMSPLSRKYPKLQLQLNSRFLDGLWYHRGGFNWLFSEQNTVRLFAQTMWRKDSNALNYLIYPTEWSSMPANANSSVNLEWTHKYNYLKGAGMYTLSARAPFLANGAGKAFNYAYAQLESINYNRLGKLEVRTRLFGRYGTGTNIPFESALFLAGANPESLMEDKYTRTRGFIPEEWQDISRFQTNHFQQGGGLNLRAYSGYFVADERGGNVLIGYKGRSGASGSIELDVDDYFPFRPKFTRNWLHADVYAFADAGIIQLSNIASTASFYNIMPTNKWSDVRVDAGAGVAITIKSWGVFEKARPLTIRFDVPVFINRPPYANPQYATFRYVVGINRSF